jgi:drug/metabolite transporter (DMT)-like permease
LQAPQLAQPRTRTPLCLGCRIALVYPPAPLTAAPSPAAANGLLGQLRALVGPALVIVGASMWGLETYWRIPLGKKLDADILVFHEHWMGLLLTLPFLVQGGRALRPVSRKAIVSMIASGILGSALGTVCFTQALALLNPSLANLLLNVQPVISVLVSWVWLRERPLPRFYPWAAVALACGVTMAWSPDALESPHRLALGLVFISATALCWGASTTFGRAAMVEIDFKTGTALRYVIGTVATFGIAAVGGDLGGRMRWGVLFEPSTLGLMAGLLVFAAITPTFLYFAGLARTRASVATFAEMAQTFASLVITWGVMGNPLQLHQVLAGVVLLVAVAFINRSVEAAPPASAPVA